MLAQGVEGGALLRRPGLAGDLAQDRDRRLEAVAEIGEGVAIALQPRRAAGEERVEVLRQRAQLARIRVREAAALAGLHGDRGGGAIQRLQSPAQQQRQRPHQQHRDRRQPPPQRPAEGRHAGGGRVAGLGSDREFDATDESKDRVRLRFVTEADLHQGDLADFIAEHAQAVVEHGVEVG